MGSMGPTLAACGNACLIAGWLEKRDFLAGYDVYAAFSLDGGRRFGRNIKVQDSFGDNVSQWHAAIAANAAGRVVGLGRQPGWHRGCLVKRLGRKEFLRQCDASRGPWTRRANRSGHLSRRNRYLTYSLAGKKRIRRHAAQIFEHDLEKIKSSNIALFMADRASRKIRSL